MTERRNTQHHFVSDERIIFQKILLFCVLNVEFTFLSITFLFRTYNSEIMEHILDEAVSNEDLKKFEQKYHEELNHGKVGDRLRLKVKHLRYSHSHSRPIIHDKIYLLHTLPPGQRHISVRVRLVPREVSIPGRYQEGNNSAGGLISGEIIETLVVLRFTHNIWTSNQHVHVCIHHIVYAHAEPWRDEQARLPVLPRHR